jgi:hypothetical protein
MKNKKHVKLILRLLAILLLCAGFTLSVMEEQRIWAFCLAAALLLEVTKLFNRL